MNILIGLCFIAVGIYSIMYTYKNSDPQLVSADLKGYLGGVVAIILGVLAVLNKVTW